MTTLYKKNGRRYVPMGNVNEWVDHWPYGHHLVTSQPGSRLTRYNINPDTAALRAAIDCCRSQLQDIIMSKMEMQPTRKLTGDQMQAWQQFVQAMGDERFIITYPSVAELVESVIDTLLQASQQQ